MNDILKKKASIWCDRLSKLMKDKGYTQQKYDGFVAEPNETTYEELKQEIQNLNVDCIVVKNPNCGEWLEKDGYQYYATVGEYYIWNMR